MLIVACYKRARAAGPGASAAAGSHGQAPAPAGEGGRGPGAAPAEAAADERERERVRERTLRDSSFMQARPLEASPGLIEAIVTLALRARPAPGPGAS
jgi:hypothetical protein